MWRPVMPVEGGKAAGQTPAMMRVPLLQSVNPFFPLSAGFGGAIPSPLQVWYTVAEPTTCTAVRV